jgi:hypothetical protein
MQWRMGPFRLDPDHACLWQGEALHDSVLYYQGIANAEKSHGFKWITNRT